MADKDMDGNTTPTLPSANKEMDLNKVKELHSNVRHITQLAMNWFAFLVTTNYLTMGWLAKMPTSATPIAEPSINSSINLNIDPHIIQTVASVFIVQNLLGIFGLICVLMAAAAMRTHVNTLELPTCNGKCGGGLEGHTKIPNGVADKSEPPENGDAEQEVVERIPNGVAGKPKLSPVAGGSDRQSTSRRPRLKAWFSKHFNIFSILEKSKKGSIPSPLYNWIGVFLMIVLASLIVAWAYIGWKYPFN
jgi:hypothetical protein